MPARGSAARKRTSPRGPAMAEWGVLVYLAGDTPWGHEAVKDDLLEILDVGSSDQLAIVVQHDGPESATRWILPPDGSRPSAPTRELGLVDSGRTAALLDFLRWGMTVCQCERLALVIGSPYS